MIFYIFSNVFKPFGLKILYAEHIKATQKTYENHRFSYVFAEPFTHMLTLYYPDAKGIGSHVDQYGGNDGDQGAPVYSLTLGNSCIFEYKLVGTKKTIHIELHSGDIIVFGGEQRLMYHGVKSVKINSFTLKENFNARINLTLRTCTGLTNEDESMYQTDVYVKRILEKRNK